MKSESITFVRGFGCTEWKTGRFTYGVGYRERMKGSLDKDVTTIKIN